MAMLPRTFPAFLLALTVVAAAFTITSAVDFHVTNSAVGTPGGDRFNSVNGTDFAKMILTEARPFIFRTLGLPNDGNHAEVQHITCVIEDTNAASTTTGSTIHISANSIERVSGGASEVRSEIAGMIYHLQTRIWQWTGKGQAPLGLIEGVADYVRYKAGFEPLDGRWVRRGGGKMWDDGDDVTAKFLDFCNDLKPGFVAMLNALMKSSYSDTFFQRLLDKTPTQLFTEYQAKYPN